MNRLSLEPARIEHTTFAILHDLIDVMFQYRSMQRNIDLYDDSWVFYAQAKMGLDRNKESYETFTRSNKDQGYSNYMSAISKLLTYKLEGSKNWETFENIKRTYLMNENGDLTGEVLSAALICNPEDQNIRDLAVKALSSEDLKRILNILSAIILEDIKVDPAIVSRARSYIESQLTYLQDFGNLNMMALAIIALNGKVSEDFFLGFDTEIKHSIIYPLFRTSIGFAEITSISRLVGHYAIPTEIISISEKHVGNLLRIEGDKLVVSDAPLEDSEDISDVDLKFASIRPSIIAKILLAFSKMGRSHGYLVTEEEKRDYFDTAQEVKSGKSVIMKKSILLLAGFSFLSLGIVFGLLQYIITLPFLTEHLLPWYGYLVSYLPFVLVIGGANWLSHAYRSQNLVALIKGLLLTLLGHSQ